MQKELALELKFLEKHQIKTIAISTTAKHAVDFAVLPRRVFEEIAISSFMVNDQKKLKELLSYFDGFIDYFYIDTELKQEINLYLIAQNVVKDSEVIAIKPNDTTLESLDILIRKKFNDNLIEKNILVIGTGNLGSKIMIRLAERQAKVFVKARTDHKADKIKTALNMFIPLYTNKIKKIEEANEIYFDIIISVISSEFTEEYAIKKHINNKTLIVDAGINNFRPNFIKQLLNNGNELLRLDTRIALPYQMIKQNDYTQKFFNEVAGRKVIKNTTIVAGGIIGEEGSVIVDQIKKPTQIIGIADGSGGVKKNETIEENRKIKSIQQFISENS